MNDWKRWFIKDTAAIPILAIISGLMLGAVIMLLGGFNPIEAYSYLFKNVFGNSYDFGETIRQITPLIFTGLSVAFAFRTGLFNIGAEGQFVMGMTGATLIGVLVEAPWFIHAPLAILSGALLAGIWGGLAGFLKARWGINEVITTIMLNWIALYLSNYLVRMFALEPNQQRSYMIHDSAKVNLDWLSAMFGDARLHWGIFVALLAAIFFYAFLWKTGQGLELRAVGHNIHAAQYAGMNVKRNVTKAMFIGGVFAGLGGAFEILGVFHYQVIAAASTGLGFDGIAVALLGGNNPFGVVLAAGLFGSLTYGSSGMSFGADIPPEIIRIIIGLVIFFVASPGIIRWVLRSLSSDRKQKEEI